ncbi:MAG TPA: hypothetical protein VGQ83_13605 [Polyangia bacterium]|jgi:hypothetical protein
MLLFGLDQRSQLALILAASISGLAGAGCGDRHVVDPMPGDAQAVDGRRDGGGDVLIVDPMPIDARYDMPVPDPMPIDAGDDVPVSDMLPPDGGWHYHQRAHELDPPPPLRTLPTEGDLADRAARADLPLPRGLAVRIVRAARPDGTVLLRAATNRPGPRLAFDWMASAGVLSSTTAGEVVWTPPEGPGRHLVQVSVRDGDRALAVDAVIVTR